MAQVPKLLEPSDVVGSSGSVNAHSVILYIAMLQQAVVAKLESVSASETTKNALEEIQKQLVRLAGRSERELGN